MSCVGINYLVNHRLLLMINFSLIECQHYKDLVARTYSIGGLCLTGRKCRNRTVQKEYKCSDFSMNTEGKEKASSKEFPHMAGQLKAISMFR